MARARITNTPHSVSMYILHVHVCGCIILSMMIGVLWWYYRAGDLGGVYQTPCVVFTGHPSLRCGDAVHFMEVWGSSPKNAVIFTGPLKKKRKQQICIILMCHLCDFTEPDFDYLHALAPYQPLNMKVYTYILYVHTI